jgi:dihydroorotase
VAEEAIIARDVLLAEHVGARLHICHVSTAGSVEIIRRAKARGINVTAEVTPHHLLLTDALAETYDPIYKVNPPLRTDEDVQALRVALADGTIDIVATDHAPHPREAKECEWSEAANGMLGLENALSVIQESMIESGLSNWSTIAERMSYAPARIGRINLNAGHGQEIKVGAFANLILVDTKIRRKVREINSASKSSNNPYLQRDLPGQVRFTFLRGEMIVANGELVKPL